MDLVIPLGSKCGWVDYQELKYALRSAQQYVPNLGHAYVIGNKPSWLKEEYFIAHPDPYTQNKDANLIQKVIRACAIPRLSKSFIRMSDDQLFLAPWKPFQWYLEQLHEGSFNRSPHRWFARLENTWKSIKHIMYPVYNFDSHVPMVYDKELFPSIVSRYNYGESPGMCINTLYANHVGGDKRKIDTTLRMGIATVKTIEELEELSKNALFCNYTDAGLSPAFKTWVETKFNTPSKFELECSM